MKLIVKRKEILKRLIEMDKTQIQAANDMKVPRGSFNLLINNKSQSFKTAHIVTKYLGGRFEDYFDIEFNEQKQEA
ncbi:hypothetical protein [Staphylococcus pettenkoferi]|uniref:hypothetical protein n=1 Tax=Staphylococcus pettenkoferi TaxID=170573 RepID=UPI0011A2DC3B|nr:hypothetical protein [Staphylococcus pettenkoferi]